MTCCYSAYDVRYVHEEEEAGFCSVHGGGRKKGKEGRRTYAEGRAGRVRINGLGRATTDASASIGLRRDLVRQRILFLLTHVMFNTLMTQSKLCHQDALVRSRKH